MDENAIGRQASERVERNWLVLEYVGNLMIRLDVALIDRIMADDADLLFDVEELQVSLTVSSGALAATSIADRLTKYTWMSPIAEIDVYQHAMQQLDGLNSGTELHQSMLLIGNEPLRIKGQDICIGKVTYPIYEVIESARVGESIRIPNGCAFQAGLALLVVAASERENADAQLRRRIADYEARIPH